MKKLFFEILASLSLISCSIKSVDPGNFEGYLLTNILEDPNKPGVSNSGLVAHFSFEGDTKDKSGNNNNGQLQGGSGKYVKAIKGNGIRLFGVNSIKGNQDPDRVFIPNSKSLQFSKELTFCFWVSIEGDLTQEGTCLGKNINGIGGTVIAKDGDRNGMLTYVEKNSASFSYLPWNKGEGISAQSLPNSYKEFHHFGYTIKNNIIKIYVDGKLKNSKTQPKNYDFTVPNKRNIYLGTVYNGTPHELGGACLNYWNQLDGIIDEVRIYNKSLTDIEIEQVYTDEARN